MKGSKPNKPALLLIAVGHLTITALTWRDIQRRPAEQIRGGKLVWRVLSALNTGNSVVYWLLARRASKPARPGGALRGLVSK